MERFDANDLSDNDAVWLNLAIFLNYTNLRLNRIAACTLRRGVVIALSVIRVCSILFTHLFFSFTIT